MVIATVSINLTDILLQSSHPCHRKIENAPVDVGMKSLSGKANLVLRQEQREMKRQREALYKEF